MTLATIVRRRLLMALFSFIMILGTYVTAWSADPSSKSEDSSGGGSIALEESIAQAEQALQAVRNNDLKAFAKYAQMALATAQMAQKDFAKRGVSKDAQQEFADGLKSLQEAISNAQGDKAEEVKKLIVESIVKMGKKHCQGGQCSSGPCGCQVEGMTNCNPFYPSKRCTTYGCNCYCM